VSEEWVETETVTKVTFSFVVDGRRWEHRFTFDWDVPGEFGSEDAEVA
jgi:hypothetical protein